MTDGEDLKADGIARALANPTIPAWKVVARDAIEYLAGSGRRFTSEDVRRLAGDPPTTPAMGAVMNAAARAGVICRVGYARAARATSHARDLSTWTGTEGWASGGTARYADHPGSAEGDPVLSVPDLDDPPPVRPRSEIWDHVPADCEIRNIVPGEATIIPTIRTGTCPVCNKKATFIKRREA